MKNHLIRTWVLVAYLGVSNCFAFTDPTRPPFYKPDATVQTSLSAGQITLSATYIYPNKRLAILNGKLFSEGDRFQHYTIESILPYSVELVSEDSKLTVSIVKQIKQPR